MRNRLTIACLAASFVVFAAPSLHAATLVLNWDPSPDAQGYVIRYGTRAAPLSSQVTTGLQTSYTLTNLADNQIYCFVVYASGDGGLLSTGSNQVCALVDPPPSLPPASDFNLDHHYDLIWQHQLTGQISTWAMNGTAMMSGVLFSPGQVGDTNWKIVGRGDMNGDGYTDLVWQNQQDGTISTWLMQNTQMLSGIVLSRVSDTNWKIVGVADANGDGKVDFFWHNRTTGMMSIWLMDGLRMADAVVLSPDTVADVSWQVAGVGDMNGDGYPDLVWQNQTNGLLSVWYLRGSRMVNWAMLNPSQVADTNWKIRAVGDLDGDGKPDLIWQHQATGTISTWLMNGNLMRAGLLLTPSVVPDTNWKIVR